jgi:PII-like signaling protein
MQEAEEVVVVRIYLAASDERLAILMRRLSEWEHVRGATAFQGHSGFGEHGSARGDAIPTVVEFFDTKDKAMEVVANLRTIVAPNHIVYWRASTLAP